jgi:hypothetical protein
LAHLFSFVQFRRIKAERAKLNEINASVSQRNNLFSLTISPTKGLSFLHDSGEPAGARIRLAGPGEYRFRPTASARLYAWNI